MQVFRKRPFLLLMAILFLIVSCDTEAPTPTPTEVAAQPTNTAVSDEPTPTESTNTPVPEPTETPAPTNTPAPTPTPAPAYVPTFEEAVCQFEPPDDRDVQCGYLTVPEDRSEPDGMQVRIHVAIFASESANPAPDPVIYLDGGPGGDALEVVPFTFEDNFSPFLADRDFIMFDQRGTGYSEPSLNCPEYDEIYIEFIDDILSEAEETAVVQEALFACQERLVEEGVDLTQYNSVTSAADLNDLRLALGYEEWNLYGISYGTKLALTTMRDYPDGIRSVILDSAYPQEVGLNSDLPANVDRAFDTFFAGCAADPDCNAAYPDLEARTFTLAEALTEAPILVPVTDFLTGDRYDAAVDGGVLLGTIFQGLYSAEIIPILPQMITNLEAGEDNLLGLLLSNDVTNRGFFTIGVNTTVQCYEEVPFETLAEVETAVAAFPELDDFFGDPNFDFTLCTQWGAGMAEAIDNEPVISNIPTLILAGEYDPITPPAWGQLVNNNLPNSYYFEYPGVGHAVTASDQCPLEMSLDFLADPSAAPSDVCIAEMPSPAFVVASGESEPVEMVDFTADLGFVVISGVRPADWEEQSPGAYLRGDTGLDQTTIIYVAGPGVPVSFFLENIQNNLGLESALSEDGTYEDINGRSWVYYISSIQGLDVTVSAADADEVGYFVVLISDPGETATLRDTVLIPAMDGLQLAE